MSLNRNIIEGKWEEIKGEVKKQWGRLTDDELKEIEGDQQKLIGMIQKHYGYSEEEIEKQLKRFTRH